MRGSGGTAVVRESKLPSGRSETWMRQDGKEGGSSATRSLPSDVVFQHSIRFFNYFFLCLDCWRVTAALTSHPPWKHVTEVSVSAPQLSPVALCTPPLPPRSIVHPSRLLALALHCCSCPDMQPALALEPGCASFCVQPQSTSFGSPDWPRANQSWHWPHLGFTAAVLLRIRRCGGNAGGG